MRYWEEYKYGDAVGDVLANKGIWDKFFDVGPMNFVGKIEIEERPQGESAHGENGIQNIKGKSMDRDKGRFSNGEKG